ncbi:MAG: bifunctional adenosylcobinamide kinase/adenosylcobinamide-phosphate guanylyltransferase, partial [Lachnospiraceae bacterium]|nr:bifunctional adenosylcobinamide kinase/adenosylcobinamide-phosphate guanylyltransferase [Lachnospiraceae bacterium]
GGSACGKSQFAEDTICRLSEGKNKYYIATMQIGDDEENIERVEKHRLMRKEKGFTTIECQVSLENALSEMSDSKNALLECVSNLVANEMFFGGEIIGKDETTGKVKDGISKLVKETDNLVVVTNNVFESDSDYDETTLSYMDALGEINAYLCTLADEVFEVVAGIPLRIK